MGEEAEQNVRAAAESREAAIGLLTDLFLGLGRGVAQPAFDFPMTTLLRVQFRRLETGTQLVIDTSCVPVSAPCSE